MEERERQKKYWIEHSSDLTMESMMVDSDSHELDSEETAEVTHSLTLTHAIFKINITLKFRTNKSNSSLSL